MASMGSWVGQRSARQGLLVAGLAGVTALVLTLVFDGAPTRGGAVWAAVVTAVVGLVVAVLHERLERSRRFTDAADPAAARRDLALVLRFVVGGPGCYLAQRLLSSDRVAIGDVARAFRPQLFVVGSIAVLGALGWAAKRWDRRRVTPS